MPGVQHTGYSVLPVYKRAIRSFVRSFALFEKSVRATRSFALFLIDQKSDLLFGALFKRAKERFALIRYF